MSGWKSGIVDLISLDFYGAANCVPDASSIRCQNGKGSPGDGVEGNDYVRVGGDHRGVGRGALGLVIMRFLTTTNVSSGRNWNLSLPGTYRYYVPGWLGANITQVVARLAVVRSAQVAWFDARGAG